jgi:hypothetical protein
VPVVSTLETRPPSLAGRSVEGPARDPFDRADELILHIRPISFTALGIALAAILMGAALQTLVVLSSGAGIPFACFFPFVAVASVLAGVPAGFAVSFGSPRMVGRQGAALRLSCAF